MAMFFMEKYEFLIKKYIFYQCKHKIKKEMLRESIEVKEAASMIVRLDVSGVYQIWELIGIES